MSEIWHPVIGFQGFYEVSDQGRVRSVNRSITVRKKDRPPYNIRCKSKLLRQTPLGGYPRVTLWKVNDRTDELVSTLVAQAFLGPCPLDHQVMHLDGLPANVTLRNLAYATREEIEAGKRARGTHVSGERISWARLSQADVQLIRSSAGDQSQREMAAQLAVSQSHISRIINGSQWKDVL